MVSGIYKWTSPSGKSYIGQAINLKKRWREFRRPNSIYTSKGSAIDNARAKYKDFENEWKYEVLEEVEIDKLNDREQYWISYYNTKDEGYNSTLGGDGNKGWKPSAEQIEKIVKVFAEARARGAYDAWNNSEECRRIHSEANKGKHMSEESKAKCRAYATGRRRTKESIEKFSRSLKKKYAEGFVNVGQKEAISKKVAQYDLDGKLIKIYPSMHQAAVAMGKKDGKCIRQVCQGKKENVYGYIWRFTSNGN